MTLPTGPAPPLLPEYQRARSLVVVASILTYLWWANVPSEGPLPVLGVEVPDEARPIVLGVLLGYGLVRLSISWAQSDRRRRRRAASVVDVSLTLLFAAPAFAALASHLWTTLGIPATPPAATIALVLFGLVVGEALSIAALDALLFIRPRERAVRLALPRLPVGVRAPIQLFLVALLPSLLLLVALASTFGEPLDSLWLWFVSTPAALVVVANLVSASLPRVAKNGEVVSARTHVRSLRRIFDRHDAHYQIGGWDTQRPHVKSALYAAAEAGVVDRIRERLTLGDSINTRGPLGWTPLNIAVANQHSDAVRVLLEAGADPNRGNLLGRTPLFFAARYGNVTMTELLLDWGADPNLNESDDDGPLAAAARSGHHDLVVLLLERGADPTDKDRIGRLPREYAEEAGFGNIAAVLRRAEQQHPA